MFGLVSRFLASHNRHVVYVRDLLGQSVMAFAVAFLGLWSVTAVTDFSSFRNVVVAGVLAGVRAAFGVIARPFGNRTSAHFSGRFR